MKIAYVMASHVPSKNANSVHVMKMCQSLAKLGHEVTLYSIFVEGIAEKGVDNVYAFYGVEPNFKIESIYFPANARLMKYRFVHLSISKLIKWQPDLVYFRGVLAAYYLNLRSRIPFILESHGPVLQSGKKQNQWMLKRLLKSKQLKQFVVITEALKDIYQTDETFTKANVNTLVLADGSDRVPDFEKINDFALRKDVLQVGYFGHLYKGRGIDIILAVAKKLEHYDFHIVGGKQKDIEYWKTQAEGITNIRFHGHVSPGMVYKYRNSCDILLAPYQQKVYVAGGQQESAQYMSPLKVFEYMASRKAIICSDMPVLREVLSESNAMLVRPDSTEEWSDAIVKLEDIILRNRIADEAYKEFNEHYTWDKRAVLALNGIKL
ncbi:glycosyltransferase family 4 protein [Carboxylicivirga mesophila]|uniref:Glycosyltransferase family 4 protein n=1 Tax=Carboxylicivirga mesophila TaxID=1166478 RepID=A0ABS5K921_9BACT|nr:glycosyltransferase family 4 protein [Carboxylicivirga mesophila]MBS2211500.1 glycosyltransferase family 4 protein [Carboxylicivirga mesophila]